MSFWRDLPFYLKEEPQRNHIIIKPVIYDLYRVKILYLCTADFIVLSYKRQDLACLVIHGIKYQGLGYTL